MSDIVFGAAGVGVLLVIVGFFTGGLTKPKLVLTREGVRREWGPDSFGWFYLSSGAIILGIGLWVLAVIYAVGLVIVRAL